GSPITPGRETGPGEPQRRKKSQLQFRARDLLEWQTAPGPAGRRAAPCAGVSEGYATPRRKLLSEAGMCALFRSEKVPSVPSQAVHSEPEAEFASATPPFIAQRQPQFLSRRSKNARGVL